MVFVDADNRKHSLSTAESISVYESNDGNELTNITWGSHFGLLAEIRPGMVYSGVQYKAGIQWILQDDFTSIPRRTFLLIQVLLVAQRNGAALIKCV